MMIWNDGLATRNLIIDKEHKELIEFLNIIDELTPNQKSLTYSLEIIRSLYRLTAQHFSHEELLMREFNYNNEQRHLGEYRVMLENFQNLINDFDRIGIGVIAAFFEQWLSGHLLREDMPLARFIQRNQKLAHDAPARPENRRKS